MAVAASDALEGDAALDELLVSRVEPFLDHPLAGVALSSGLARLRDHLLGQAADGSLSLDDAVRERSPVALIERGEGVAARCQGLSPLPRADVEGSIEAFACALLQGGPAADSPLVTEPSRVQLARRPLPVFESRAHGAALDAARPWTVSRVGDRAAVKHGRDTRESPPLLLVREEGTWRVDLVEMGKAFRQENGRWKCWSERGPYWLVIDDKCGFGTYVDDLTPVELWGEKLGDAIVRLERTEGPVAKVRLAEILLRNAWLPGEALVQWDAALALAPDELRIANLFADRVEYLEYPLLGAIALAPHGPPALIRMGELFVRAGKIETGAANLRQGHVWRTLRDAHKAAPREPEPLARSI
jgi:hypothetical protein